MADKPATARQFCREGWIDQVAYEIYHLDVNNTNADLRKYLSVRSVISTASFTALKEQDVKESIGLRGFISVGIGNCAEIFHHAGTGTVIKKPHPGQYELWYDLRAHQGVYEAVQAARYSDPSFMLQVPKIFNFHSRNNAEWWNNHRNNFAPGKREPTNILTTERIVPLPVQVRTELIELFCPPALKADALANPSNKDCLIRLYLGRRLATPPQVREWRGLRNYEADLSILDLLAVETMDHAKTMGIAMACMHFDAKIDARDVEFVLGTGLSDPKVLNVDIEALEEWTDLDVIKDFKRRIVQVWLLDFNQCRRIEMTEDGIEKACRAFYDNDPYYPRPVPEDHQDRKLWDTFEKAYMSKAIGLGREDLALYFCKSLINEAQSRSAAKSVGPPHGGPPMGGPREDGGSSGDASGQIPGRRHVKGRGKGRGGSRPGFDFFSTP